jgi:hypothetical protein
MRVLSIHSKAQNEGKDSHEEFPIEDEEFPIEDEES